MKRFFVFLLVGIGLFVGLSSQAYAQAKPSLSSASVRIDTSTMYGGTGGAVPVKRTSLVYSFTVANYRPGLAYRIVGDGSTLVGNAKVDKATISSKLDYTPKTSSDIIIRLVDEAMPDVVYDTYTFKRSAPATVASGTNTGGSAVSAGECYKFSGTLFGDGICANDYLSKFYAWAVGIAVVGASLMVIFAGYKYTLSRGDPSKITDAKDIIYNVILGLVLLVLSYAILRYLGINVVSR